MADQTPPNKAAVRDAFQAAKAMGGSNELHQTPQLHRPTEDIKRQYLPAESLPPGSLPAKRIPMPTSAARFSRPDEDDDQDDDESEEAFAAASMTISATGGAISSLTYPAMAATVG